MQGSGTWVRITDSRRIICYLDVRWPELQFFRKVRKLTQHLPICLEGPSTPGTIHQTMHINSVYFANYFKADTHTYSHIYTLKLCHPKTIMIKSSVISLFLLLHTLFRHSLHLCLLVLPYAFRSRIRESFTYFIFQSSFLSSVNHVIIYSYTCQSEPKTPLKCNG